MKNLIKILSILSICGCSSIVMKHPVPEPAVAAAPAKPVEKKEGEVKPADGAASGAVTTTDEEPMTKFSDLNNMAPPSDRQYKRMTRQKMEEESELYGSAGSLWKMEGQTSFLFAENKHRREGDPTAIKLEGTALKLIENKVAVIQDLLKQLEEQKKKAEEDAKNAEQEKQRLAQVEEEKKLRAERIAKGEYVEPLDDFPAPAEATRAPAAADANKKPEKEEKIDLKEVELIPSKIVEKMSDDVYRIRGQQFLTIKKKPYKVIATALIRAEDFNDANVSSSKLLDAQFDVIHVKGNIE